MTQRRICYRCIGDPVLQEEVRREGRQAACFYCGKRRKCISLAELANRIEEVIDKQFHLTPNYPDGYEATLASEGDWERSGELIGQVIADIAGLDGVPAEDVRELLSDRYGYEAMKGGEEDPYGSEAHYEENSLDQYNFRESWEFFSREIRFRSRFFNAHAQRALSDIFGDVATLQTWQGQKAVREITPADEGRHLYRARIAYSGRDLQDILEDPVRGLGPPPSRAATAGRMNAAGVSVFYGAKEEDTCLAEVRALACPLRSGPP